jgi:hypothetical protein
MPAPVPIRIRYDAAGALGQAAVAAGRGEALQRQRDRDAAFLNAELDRQQRAREVAYRNQLEHAKLAQRSRLAGSPTVSSGSSRTYDRNMAEQVRRGRLAEQAGLDEQDRILLDLASEYGDRDTVSRLLRQAGGQVATPMSQAKQAYLKNIAEATNLPDDERAALAALAGSDDVNLSQLRVAASQAASRAQEQSGQLSPRYATVLRVRGLDDRMSALQKKALALRKKIEDAGFDPSGPPTQFNPTVREPGGTISEGLRNVADVFLPGQPLSQVTTGGDPDAMRTFSAYQQTLAELQEAERERQAILSGQVPQQQSPGALPQTQQNADPLGILQ